MMFWNFSALWILGSIKALLAIPLLSVFGSWHSAGLACKELPPVIKEVATAFLAVPFAPIIATVLFVLEFGIAGFSIRRIF